MTHFCDKCGQRVPTVNLVLKAIGTGTSNLDYIKSQMPIEITHKEIYNALGFLVRHRIVERTARRHYRAAK